MRGRKADSVIRDLGLRVAELRKRAGLTQEGLAEILGVSIKYVQRIESGSNLTVRSLVKLAQTLSVEPGALLTRPRSRTRPSVGRPRS